MKLKAAIPLFRIFDYPLAKRFYVDWLGFRIDWEHQFSPTAPRYIQISRDALVLHLTEHYGDGSPGAACGRTPILGSTGTTGGIHS